MPLDSSLRNSLILCVCREVAPTSHVRLEVQIKTGHLAWVKRELISKEIDLQYLFNDYWTTTADEITLQGPSWSTLSPCIYLIENRRGRDRWKVSLRGGTTILCKHYRLSLCNSPLRPAEIFAQAEYLRSSLHKLEDLLKNYSPLMSDSKERVLDKVIQYGAAFSEVSSPRRKRARC